MFKIRISTKTIEEVGDKSSPNLDEEVAQPITTDYRDVFQPNKSRKTRSICWCELVPSLLYHFMIALVEQLGSLMFLTFFKRRFFSSNLCAFDYYNWLAYCLLNEHAMHDVFQCLVPRRQSMPRFSRSLQRKVRFIDNFRSVFMYASLKEKQT